jgi:hypothetical protein
VQRNSGQQTETLPGKYDTLRRSRIVGVDEPAREMGQFRQYLTSILKKSVSG